MMAVRYAQNLRTTYLYRTFNRTVPAYRPSVQILKRTVPLINLVEQRCIYDKRPMLTFNYFLFISDSYYTER